MLYRDNTIDNGIKKIGRYIKLPRWIAIVFYVFFAPIIAVVEEFLNAYQTFVDIRGLAKIMVENKEGDTLKLFNKLSRKDQNAFEQHYQQETMRNTRRLQIMAREASVQLIYQNALVMYQFFYQPVLELDFNSWENPSARWISGLMLQILSILLSGYSTFSPIVDNLKFKSHVEGKPAGFYNYLTKVLHVLGHILMSTGAVFLLLGSKHVF